MPPYSLSGKGKPSPLNSGPGAGFWELVYPVVENGVKQGRVGGTKGPKRAAQRHDTRQKPVSVLPEPFLAAHATRPARSRRSRTIKWLGATTPIYLVSLYVPAAFVGLGGALAIPELEVADRVFPELLFRYASPWLTGVILAGAAAMSTLDSILHANMTVLTRDVYQRYVRADASQAHYVWVGRAIVAVLSSSGTSCRLRPRGFWSRWSPAPARSSWHPGSAASAFRVGGS